MFYSPRECLMCNYSLSKQISTVAFFFFFSRPGSLMRLTGWQSAACCHCVMCWNAAWTPSRCSVQWAANGLGSTARDGRRPPLICFGSISPLWFVCDTEFVSRLFAFRCFGLKRPYLSCLHTDNSQYCIVSCVTIQHCCIFSFFCPWFTAIILMSCPASASAGVFFNSRLRVLLIERL